MIDPKQIPGEAVEAAARKMAETQDDDWSKPDLFITTASDTAESCRDVYREMARAAIAAAINAWPGRGMRTIMDANGSYPTIFLPLPAPEEKP